MKQTNNAIKFLMAQYRAIFKHAYLKGIASAVVLTAGLAAGQAQAVETPTGDYWYFNESNNKWEHGKSTVSTGNNLPIVTGTLDSDRDFAEPTISKDSGDAEIASGATFTIGTGGAINSINALSNTAGKPSEISAAYAERHSGGDATVKGATLNVNSGATIGSTVDLLGAKAYSKSGSATVEGNTLNITLDPKNALGQAINLRGATADGFTQATASNNTVSGTGLTLADGSLIFGATAKISGQTNGKAIESVTAAGNRIVLNNITFGTAAADEGANMITGNLTDAGDAKPTSIIADGQDKVSVSISGSDIYVPRIFGAYVTASSGAGTASAVNNVVSLTDTNIIGTDGTGTDTARDGKIRSDIFGAVVNIKGLADADKATLEASNNKISISSTGDTYSIDAGDAVSGSLELIGAQVIANAATSNTSLSGSTLTADNNQVVIGKNVKVTLNGGNIVGAAFAVYDDNQSALSGVTSTISAKGNLVEINGDVTGSTSNGTSTIAAVSVGNGKALVLNNDVVVNGKVTNVTTFVGGAGQDSEIKLGSDGFLNFTNSVQNTLVSDVVTLAGKVAVTDSTAGKLDIQGYYTNGSAAVSSGNFNPNQTTIESTAEIQNAGTITLYGQTTVKDGAKLSATAAGASIVVNGGSNSASGKVDDKLLGADEDDPSDDNILNNHGEFVGGKGSLTLSSATLDSYLTSTDYTPFGTTTAKKDAKGSVQLTSGGALEFTDDSVILSNYEFSITAKDAGKIVVDSAAGNGGSIIKGKTIVIEHQLAENTSTAKQPFTSGTKTEDLTEATAAGIFIEADTLKLGSTQLEKKQSEDIKFAQARAKKEIDFTVKSGSFQLTSKVLGNNYMRTQDQAEDLDYYTALNGTITGDVNVTNGGSLTIEYGNWTAKDDITLSSGGALNVGIDNSSADPVLPLGNHNSLPDATLTLDKALTINVGDGNDASTITVDGNVNGNSNDRYDFEDAADTIGDDHLVLLDLSKGLQLQTDKNGNVNGKTTITVTNGGIIKLNATDLNDILALNNKNGVDPSSGAFFSGSSFGVFDVAGDVEATFSDFGGNTTHNGITLGQDGYLVADSLSVLNQHSGQVVEDAQNTVQSLNLGDESGTVIVGDLVISDLQQTNGTKPSGSNEYASKVVFAQGTAIVSKSLTSNNNTLVLGDGSSNGTNAHITLESEFSADEGKVDVANIQLTNSSSFDVLNGAWDATKTTFKLSGTSSLTVGGGFGEDAKEVAFAPSLQASGIVLGAGTSLNVKADGTASFATADFSKLTANDSVSVAGTLIINGSDNAKLADGKDDPANGVDFGASGSIQIENNGVLKFGSLATTGAIIADGTYSGADSIKMQDGYTQIANNGGELHLGLASSTKFDGDAIKALKSALFTSDSLPDGVLVDGGVLNIGQATFSGIHVYDNKGEGLSGYKAAWKDLKGFSDIYGSDVTNDQLVQTNAYDIGVSDQVQGHWGSLSMASNVAKSAQVTIAGNTSLRFAEGNNGFFISNADHTEARGAIVESQKDLTLIGGGEIGKVTLEAGANGTDKNLTVLEVRDGDTTIAAIEGSQAGAGIAENTYVDINSNTTVTGDINNIGTVGVYNGAKLTAANAKVDFIETENATAWIKGNLNFVEGDVIGGLVQVDDTATMTEVSSRADQDLNIAHNGTFKAKNFVAASGSQINVGFDSTNESYTLDDGTKILGTGYFDVDTLKLNGATIVVDPAYGEKTSVAGTLHFQKNKETFGVNDAGTLVGSMQIGANAAYGVGANVADTLAAIATYQTNGSLSKDKYGSILYLNGQLKVDQGSEIALNSDDSATADIRDSLKYTRENQVLDQYADLGLGANTAILMTEQAFEDQDGKRNGTAIYFNRKAAVVNGAGGDILLSGTFDASDRLNIFNDLDNDGVKVEGSIDVMTQNGFLYATLSGEHAGMGVQLEVDKDKAYSIMSEASDPVVETLISYHADRIGQTDSTTGDESIPATEINDPSKSEKTLAAKSGANVSVGGDTTETPSTPDQGTEGSTGDTGGDQGTSSIANTKVSGNSEFLNEVVNTSHGAPAESAARLAVYGGAAQAALTANTANTEVIAARLGVGAQNSALSFADNGQGAGLWVAPIYKNHDSDGFSAQGLNYGVDMDLYGLALGGDYTLANGIRVGAMFNVGSGDADGQGNAAAANTSNDFDYWGVAVYGGYSFDALSITADFGYTVVDNDLEATTGMENTTKLTASTDTSALTFGVTGQYKFDFDGLVVAPHAGLRYTYLDMDDYTVKGNEDVASYSADSMSIFSIPVGVAVSKEFAAGEWTVKPSFDLTLTANLGDDTMDGNVTWANVNNLSTHVESEIVDSFTYGASLGVAAKTGNFSLGFGINYTGASNADEYGVNANARFVF